VRTTNEGKETKKIRKWGSKKASEKDWKKSGGKEETSVELALRGDGKKKAET